jgi:pimeloyl-ACP methyl ester carboxylesterase
MSERRLSPFVLPLAALAVAALLLAGINGVGALASVDASARPGTLARLPDGRRLNFRCSGEGAPTILFEGGFAATSLAWVKVQSEVARRYRACAYDRAGYGFSDPGPPPRDGAATAKDLDDGLRALHIQGPFILVGHSAGGLYMRLFADRRPGDIAGMVLVDPSIEHQDQRFAALFGPGAGGLQGQRSRAQTCLAAAKAGTLPSKDPALAPCTPTRRPTQPPAEYDARLAEAVRPSTWATQLSELDSLWGSTSSEVDAGRSAYGRLPLVVLTADGTNAGSPAAVRPALDALWRSLHQEIAHHSERGAERLVAGSSHMMMLDKPEAVVQAIDAVVAKGRVETPNHGTP